MNCKDCKFIKCLRRTDKEFEVCPVEREKREYLAKEKDKSE
jgi:hypothetical protein